ncbi:MAG: hypothetical protein WA865_14770 [Spirulinaceae cyanobacterium]
MTGKILDNGANTALILILPIALVLVFLFVAWPFVLGIIVFVIAWTVWQHYQWKQWSQEVNPFFNQLIRENQGCLTAVDLSVKANLTGAAAQRFLEKKAEEYGAQRQDYENKGAVYYFLTASALGSILDDSEPLPLLPDQEEVFTSANSEFEDLIEPDLEVVHAESSTLTETPVRETPLKPSQVQGIVQGEIRESQEEEIQTENDSFLIQAELAKRLGVHPSTIAKRRIESDFSQWSKSKDPEAIAWEYSQKDKVFYQV